MKLIKEMKLKYIILFTIISIMSEHNYFKLFCFKTNDI